MTHDQHLDKNKCSPQSALKIGFKKDLMRIRFACILNAELLNLPNARFFFQKPASAGPSTKPAGATAAAAARSRLAAAKAAMKAKQQAAERAAKEEETPCPDMQEPQAQGAPALSSSMPVEEGLSLANSPLKPPGKSRTLKMLFGISVLLCSHVANFFTIIIYFFFFKPKIRESCSPDN